MTDVTIFGSGNMGTAIDGGADRGRCRRRAHRFRRLRRRPSPATSSILAVPDSALEWPSLPSPDHSWRARLSWTSAIRLTVPAESSAAAELADALPSSKVLKAFNTTLALKTVGQNRTTVLIAGDAANAKAALSEWIPPAESRRSTLAR